jgi:prefoldin subunit 5
MAELQMYNKKIKDLENESNNYKDRVRSGQGELDKAKSYAKQLEQQNKNIEKAMNDLGRKASNQE